MSVDFGNEFMKIAIVKVSTTYSALDYIYIIYVARWNSVSCFVVLVDIEGNKIWIYLIGNIT